MFENAPRCYSPGLPSDTGKNRRRRLTHFSKIISNKAAKIFAKVRTMEAMTDSTKSEKSGIILGERGSYVY